MNRHIDLEKTQLALYEQRHSFRKEKIVCENK